MYVQQNLQNLVLIETKLFRFVIIFLLHLKKITLNIEY